MKERQQKNIVNSMDYKNVKVCFHIKGSSTIQQNLNLRIEVETIQPYFGNNPLIFNNTVLLVIYLFISISKTQQIIQKTIISLRKNYKLIILHGNLSDLKAAK